MGVIWDTLKAFLHGIMIQQVSKIKKRTKDWESVAGETVVTMEEQYVSNPTPDTLRAWSEEQWTYRTLMARKAENKQLFQRQNIFGEGERVG